MCPVPLRVLGTQESYATPPGLGLRKAAGHSWDAKMGDGSPSKMGS